MNQNDYSQCSSALELLVCAMQNAIITFMNREHLIQPLEHGHYIYHQTLDNALGEKSTPKKVTHAFVEINRYCLDHNDSPCELFHLFITEMKSAIIIHGLHIHQQELQRHGRTFKQ